MNRKKRTTRGVTLAELCVVMAVIAIVSTMVVSFTVLMQARTSLIAADRDTIADIGSVESALDRFIRTYDSDEYTLSVTDPESKDTLTVSKGENKVASLMISLDPEGDTAEKIVITDPAGNITASYPLHLVKNLEYEIINEDEIIKSDTSGDSTALVICKITYTRTSGNAVEEKTATICHAVRAMKTN